MRALRCAKHSTEVVGRRRIVFPVPRYFPAILLIPECREALRRSYFFFPEIFFRMRSSRTVFFGAL